MATKKKTEADETIQTPSETEALSASTKKEVSEKLLAFTVSTRFVDGNLGEFFSKYGYTAEWNVNEVRNIPVWLALRCKQSGAELVATDG
jgi:hypothetical protein